MHRPVFAFLGLITILFFLNSCSGKSKILVDGLSTKEETPPGTVQVGSNFFADVVEVQNISYREYTTWMQRVYGEESQEYLACLPDFTVWPREMRYGEPLYREGQHFYHPAYNDYPVVGISLKKAEGFSVWRSNRVAERLLIEDGIIERVVDLNKDNNFTLERYLSGEFESILRARQVVLLPVYSIPTEDEWEQIARGDSNNEYGLDSLSRKFRKNKPRFNLYDEVRASRLHPRYEPAPNLSTAATGNVNGLQDIIGNVAEMVWPVDSSSDMYTKGGSCKSTLEEAAISNSEIFTVPNYYTGFRNVCRYKFFHPLSNKEL